MTDKRARRRKRRAARQNSVRYPSPRSQHPRLLEKYGACCQGCGRNFIDNPSALEVDHIRPKSDGGTDAYENLTLLCPPCNRFKSDTMTLTGLQQYNRREDILLPENEANLKLGRSANIKWRAALAAALLRLAQAAPEEWAAYQKAAQLAWENPDMRAQYVAAAWQKRMEAAAPEEWAAYKAAREIYESKKAGREAAKAALKAAAYRKAYERSRAALEALTAASEAAYKAAAYEAARYKAAYQEYEIKKAELKAAMSALAPDELAAHQEYETKKTELKAATDSDALIAWKAAHHALAEAAPAEAKAYFALQAAYQKALRGDEQG